MDIATVLLVIGRVLLASLFVAAGIKHCFVAKEIVPAIAARGIPYPKLVLGLGSAFEFLFGLMLMFGIAGPWAPLGLAAFTIAATLMLVNFWDMQGPERAHATTSFQYNVAIVGGLLIAATASL
jgi:putative oxidoreductase